MVVVVGVGEGCVLRPTVHDCQFCQAHMLHFSVCQGEMPAASPVGVGIKEREAGPTCFGRDAGMTLTACSHVTEADRPPWH